MFDLWFLQLHLKYYLNDFIYDVNWIFIYNNCWQWIELRTDNTWGLFLQFIKHIPYTDNSQSVYRNIREKSFCMVTCLTAETPDARLPYDGK